MASDIEKVAEELRRRGVASQESKDQSKQSVVSPAQSSSSKQYTQSVAEWLELYRGHYMAHYTMTVAPYYMAMGYAQAACQFMVNQSFSANLRSGVNSNGASQPNQAAPARNVQNAAGPVLAREFIIPSIYRRIFAEFIDFVLLFSIKLTITMYAILYFGIVDQTSFALKFLAEEIDEDATMEDLQQVLDSIFSQYHEKGDAWWCYSGKFMMGLRTISCERVQTLAPGRVQVTLPDNLTYIQSFGRAVIKNFSMAFFFPACITIFFNPHLRSTYDIIAKTVVVLANQDTPNDINNNRNPGR